MCLGIYSVGTYFSDPYHNSNSTKVTPYYRYFKMGKAKKFKVTSRQQNANLVPLGQQIEQGEFAVPTG